MNALDELLKDATAGDPITGLKWTKKNSHTISRARKRQGYEVGDDTVRRLLKKRSYVLRANRKRLNKRKDSNRDRQMRYLVRTRKQHEINRPVPKGRFFISVNSKKLIEKLVLTVRPPLTVSKYQ